MSIHVSRYQVRPATSSKTCLHLYLECISIMELSIPLHVCDLIILVISCSGISLKTLQSCERLIKAKVNDPAIGFMIHCNIELGNVSLTPLIGNLKVRTACQRAVIIHSNESEGTIGYGLAGRGGWSSSWP